VLRHIFAEAGDWKGIGLPLAVFSDDDNEEVPLQDPGLADLAVEFEVT
jgi:hypothetical protein